MLEEDSGSPLNAFRLLGKSIHASLDRTGLQAARRQEIIHIYPRTFLNLDNWSPILQPRKPNPTLSLKDWGLWACLKNYRRGK